MAVANAWGAAGLLLRPSPLPLRDARYLSLGGPALRRPILRGDYCPPSLSCRCSNSATATSGGDEGRSISDWDWNRWSRHFSEIEQAENLASILMFQLKEAIKKDDFLEAARLKIAIEEATSKDVVAEVLTEFKNAIEEERYQDATRLSDSAGSGLVGWWAGCSENSDDPFGRIVQITPAFGRYVAKSYSPRQLLRGSSEDLLFEIFLIREDDGTYKTQVVALQRAKDNSTQSAAQTLDGPAASSSGNASSERNPTTDIAADNGSDGAGEKRDKGATVISAEDEEFIYNILNFVKEKFPGLKFKVGNATVPEKIKEAESLEQLVKEDDEKNASNEDIKDEENTIVQACVGDFTHKKERTLSKSYIRVPAEMKDVKNDSFILHIPGKSDDTGPQIMKPHRARAASVATQSAFDLKRSAKAFSRRDKAISKVPKEVGEVIGLAFCYALLKDRLPKMTTFNRIICDNKGLDPFDGIYAGVFGAYGTEVVVHLQRKYGNWNDANELDSDMKFFEYVEAIKLTGDLNVPAGQVTFRAKIGKENHLPNNGLYPEEHGVVSIYKGQGKIADPGFKNPRWVDGELFQLSGKGLSRGRKLGFHYGVPEQSYVVLLTRLKLPD